MKCQIADSIKHSEFFGEFNDIFPAIEVENFVAFTLVTIFLDNTQGNIEQADHRERIRFLPTDM